MGRGKLKKKEYFLAGGCMTSFLVAVLDRLAGWLAHGQRYSYGEGRRGSVKSDLDRECHVTERDSSRG